jgi:hypothetical protein
MSVTELVSMLVPLQGTLPGWPTAATPTAIQVLGLLIGVPGLIVLIISLIGKGPELIRAGRGEDASHVDEPLWLGSAPADRAALTAGSETAPAAGQEVVASSSQPALGGASVRW